MANNKQLSIVFLVPFLVCVAFYVFSWLVVLVYIHAIKNIDSSSLRSNMQLS